MFDFGRRLADHYIIHTLVLLRRQSVGFAVTEIKVRLCDRVGKGTDILQKFSQWQGEFERS
jgi:hypothetical protein